MLHSARALSRYDVHAADGKIGRGVDAYFADSTREIRFLVVETGRWLPGKRLLIPVERLGLPDVTERVVTVDLTREESKSCEPAAQELPISWQKEELITARYGPLEERGGAPVASIHGSVSREALELVEANTREALGSERIPRLRSLRELVGYQIEAVDGPLGVAEDFLIEDEVWVIRYIAVDTKSWKPGRQVLVPPLWLESVSWAERRIHLRVSRHKIKASQRVAPGSHTSDRG